MATSFMGGVELFDFGQSSGDKCKKTSRKDARKKNKKDKKDSKKKKVVKPRKGSHKRRRVESDASSDVSSSRQRGDSDVDGIGRKENASKERKRPGKGQKEENKRVKASGFTEAELLAAKWTREQFKRERRGEEVYSRLNDPHRHAMSPCEKKRDGRNRSRSPSRSRSRSSMRIQGDVNLVVPLARECEDLDRFGRTQREDASRSHHRSRSRSHGRGRGRTRSRSTSTHGSHSSRSRSRSRSRERERAMRLSSKPPADPPRPHIDPLGRGRLDRDEIERMPDWMHDKFDPMEEYEAMEEAKERLTRAPYKPPEVEWFSRAGGVYIPNPKVVPEDKIKGSVVGHGHKSSRGQDL